MGKPGQHVVPNDGGWSVRRSGSVKATVTFDTQEQAIEAATRIAKNQGTRVYIHGQDGRIRERNSFANDPFPAKG